MPDFDLQSTIDSVAVQNAGQSRVPATGNEPGGFTSTQGGVGSGAVLPLAPLTFNTGGDIPEPPITADNVAINNAATVAQTTATPGVVPAATPDTTVGDSFAQPVFTAGSLDTRQETFTPFDEDRARRQSIRDQLKLHQAEIDATNQIFDQQLDQARVEGLGRLGSQRATSARSGVLGSDFGAAQKEKVLGFNKDIARGLQAERVAAIGSIMSRVRSSAQAELTEKREARAQGAQEYLDFLARGDERKANNTNQIVGDLIAQGVNPNEMDEKELKTILEGSSVSVNDVIAGYAQAKFAQEEGQEGNEFGFMSTTGGIFRTDPKTGEAKFIAAGGGGGGTTGGSGSTLPEGAREIPAEDSAPEGWNVERIGGKLYTWPREAGVPSFKEYLNARMEQEQMSFGPELIEETRKEYEKRYASAKPSLTNLTSSSKQSLEQAGLSNAPGDVQTFFLNAPSDFRGFFSQAVALGNFTSDISAEEMKLIQDEFEEQESSSSGREI